MGMEVAYKVKRVKEIPFFQVENQIMDYDIFDESYEKLVYLQLCRHAHNSTGATASNETLARAAYCGKTKIKQVLRRLEDKQLIQITERYDEVTKAQLSNLIVILEPPHDLFMEDRYFYKRRKENGGRPRKTENVSEKNPSRNTTPYSNTPGGGSYYDPKKEQHYKEQSNYGWMDEPPSGYVGNIDITDDTYQNLTLPTNLPNQPMPKLEDGKTLVQKADAEDGQTQRALQEFQLFSEICEHAELDKAQTIDLWKVYIYQYSNAPLTPTLSTLRELLIYDRYQRNSKGKWTEQEYRNITGLFHHRMKHWKRWLAAESYLG